MLYVIVNESYIKTNLVVQWSPGADLEDRIGGASLIFMRVWSDIIALVLNYHNIVCLYLWLRSHQ